MDQSQNGGVYDPDAALRHQIAHVAITRLVSDIPSHGLNDKKMVEMMAFEEFGLLGRECSTCYLSFILPITPACLFTIFGLP